MSSVNYVMHELQKLGLSAEISGETIYCEDIDLDFDRSHDGVRGVSKWFTEVREEYAEVIRELHEDSLENQADLELAEITLEKEFAPAPPEKEHVIDSAQLALSKELNMSPKETAQAAEIDDQDRGGIPNPETHTQAVVVLVKGQRFLAPEGWKIKEVRPSGTVVWYGSIYQDRKAENEARGAEFSLVRS